MIHEHIKNGDYEYPTKPTKPKRVCEKCGNIFEETDNYCSICGTELNYNKKIKEWKQKVIIWRRDCNAIDEKFKNDFFEYFEVTNHPKRDIFFNISWEYGHSDGLHSVIEYGEELIELIN